MDAQPPALTDAEQVGRRLRQLRRELAAREERDVEGAEVAAAVEVSDAAYSRYELGKRIPKPAVLAALAKHFGVTRSYLLFGEEKAAGTTHVKARAARGTSAVKRAAG